MKLHETYSIFPLGDAALIIEFAAVIDREVNEQVLHLFHSLKKLALPEVWDIVPAYNSISVFYDVLKVKAMANEEQTAFDFMANKIQGIISNGSIIPSSEGRLIEIPVCYDLSYASDLIEVAIQKSLSIEEVIQLHTSKKYRVYMIGFLPGFAYMGEVDEKIEVPRKAIPVHVVSGSVGIAGKQTGIYPLPSPGGWQIIGRTPLPVFNASYKEPVLLKPGDIVQFFPITQHEFENYKGRST